MAYAGKRGRSVCILFAGLVKAFDRVVRELVFGFPAHIAPEHAARLVYLESLGLISTVAQQILKQIEEKIAPSSSSGK
eukprot:4668909-Pyramimonas_sp.AAC.1